VLIPSYNRPAILESCLENWLAQSCVSKVIIIAEGSSKLIYGQYLSVLSKHQKSERVIYKLTQGRLGSIKARNLLLDLSVTSDCELVIMADDDYLPPSEWALVATCKRLQLDLEMGAIGGKVLTNVSRADGDFFLNTPFSTAADVLSKFTGYIFLDVKHGPRYSEFLTPFVILKSEIIKSISYDELFDTPTAFREESDIQAQIRRLHYKLFFDPNLLIVHLALTEGGNRPNISFSERMYWKARNSLLFVWKWNRSYAKRLWYTFFCTIILLVYRPWSGYSVLRGIKKGISDSYRKNNERLD
jgi:glycosyltransferase involved in cell wall biosynthesis